MLRVVQGWYHNKFEGLLKLQQAFLAGDHTVERQQGAMNRGIVLFCSVTSSLGVGYTRQIKRGDVAKKITPHIRVPRLLAASLVLLPRGIPGHSLEEAALVAL